jgi:hypothetical protein
MIWSRRVAVVARAWNAVYAHVRLRLQRQAIDLLSHALRQHSGPPGDPDDSDEPPLRATPVR